MQGALAEIMECLFCTIEQSPTGGSRLEARLQLGAPRGLPSLVSIGTFGNDCSFWRTSQMPKFPAQPSNRASINLKTSSFLN